MCISSSLEKNMIVAEQFLKELIKKYGKYPVSTTDDDVGSSTWYYYPQPRRSLKLRHYTHSLVLRKEYSIIENYSIHKKDR
jgi:hypothetical protein